MLALPLIIIAGYWASSIAQKRTRALNYVIWCVERRLATAQAVEHEYDQRMAQDLDPDNPQNPENIWCNGIPIPWGTEHGQALWEETVRRAIHKGLYNSKNLEEGGWIDMQVDYYRVQGYSRQRAEDLVNEQLALGNIAPLSALPPPRA